MLIRSFTALATTATLAFGGTALAQQAAESDGNQNEQPVVEEVIVRGIDRSALRIEIQIAEEAVYERFNDINSSDDFDIHCRREMLTGSRIPRRMCQANFLRDALERAGIETARALQGSMAISASHFLAEASVKGQFLAEEMRQLAVEDEQLQNALVHLATLTERMDSRSAQRSQRRSTLSRVVTTDDEDLPYGASLAADVRIRGEPWTHEVTNRIFTISNVFGEIESVEIECDNASEQIVYEAGAEWTLPEKWTSCSLQVRARRGTTFSYYEFQ